jgi:hypothetical protein
MPEVSRFYGIIVRFYYREHPPTHFHAIYGGHEALIEIEPAQFTRATCREQHTTSSTSGAQFTFKNFVTTGIVRGSNSLFYRLGRLNEPRSNPMEVCK